MDGTVAARRGSTAVAWAEARPNPEEGLGDVVVVPPCSNFMWRFIFALMAMA